MVTADRIAYEQHLPEVLGLLEQVEHSLAKTDTEGLLHHLVKLRASQINGCGYCVQMHTAEARKDGETDKRLDHLVVWRHVSDYTDKEKAAFAWCEALTEMKPDTQYSALRATLREYFSDKDIGGLTSIIAMINLWNRLQISNHS